MFICHLYSPVSRSIQNNNRNNNRTIDSNYPPHTKQNNHLPINVLKLLSLPHTQCIAPTWYLSLDLQLVLVTPLFLFPLRKYGYRFMPVMIIVTLISGANVFRLCLLEKFSFPQRAEWFEPLSYPTHNRIGVWLIGMGLGYTVFVTKNKRMTIPKVNMKHERKKKWKLVFLQNMFVYFVFIFSSICGFFRISFKK